MKRRIAFALVIILVLMTAGTAMAAKIKLTAKMHIRTGPGENYASVGIMSSGKVLKVSKANSKDGTLWFKITSGKYRGRYVSSQYSTTTISKFKINVRTTGAVNFRCAPTAAADKICTIDSGKKIVCTGYRNGWFRIIYKGITGYVYGYRLKPA